MKRPEARARLTRFRGGGPPSTPWSQPMEVDSVGLQQLFRELECHSANRCVDCYVPELGFHEAVCLTADEISLLERLLHRVSIGSKR